MDETPDDLCPWCRDDLDFHCKAGHPTCTWTVCKRCKITMDLRHHVAVQGTSPIEWPFTTPDA